MPPLLPPTPRRSSLARHPRSSWSGEAADLAGTGTIGKTGGETCERAVALRIGGGDLQLSLANPMHLSPSGFLSRRARNLASGLFSGEAMRAFDPGVSGRPHLGGISTGGPSSTQSCLN